MCTQRVSAQRYCFTAYCYICVLILLLHMCLHITIYVSSYYFICVLSAFPPSATGTPQYVKSGGLLKRGDIMAKTRPWILWSPNSSCCYDALLLHRILLYMCPHTTIYVSSWILWSPNSSCMCVSILLYVSSYCYKCVCARHTEG